MKVRKNQTKLSAFDKFQMKLDEGEEEKEEDG